MLLIGLQISATDCKWVTPSLISIEGENRREGTCSPASVPLFSHVNGGAVLNPGHHLPFLRVWAPSTPDVSHCLCVSKQKVVSTHGSCGPKGSTIKSTSLLFISLHVTELACPVCSNIRAIQCLFCCEPGSDLMCDVTVSNRWLRGESTGQRAFISTFVTRFSSY